MNGIVRRYIEKLEMGELRKFGKMALFPLFSPLNGGPAYITMKEGLEGGLLAVTEVGANGSVPELRVVNRARIPVLLLDGEELAGARQNRVLNTTILLRERSETIIPVSCTERGRWSYGSRGFRDSGVVMPHSLRKEKCSSVSLNVAACGEFHADQGAVWEGIHYLAESAGVRSPTGAMKDIHDTMGGDLEGYLEAFAVLPGQRGLLVLVDGRVAGLDAVSLESAYRVLHPRLVESYAMDALLKGRRRPGPGGGQPAELAGAFLERATACLEREFPSVGHGADVRLRGEEIVGSALVYRDHVIHAAFFGREPDGDAGEPDFFPILRRPRSRAYVLRNALF